MVLPKAAFTLPVGQRGTLGQKKGERRKRKEGRKEEKKEGRMEGNPQQAKGVSSMKEDKKVLHMFSRKLLRVLSICVHTGDVSSLQR